MHYARPSVHMSMLPPTDFQALRFGHRAASIFSSTRNTLRIGLYFFIGMIRYDCLRNSGLSVFHVIIASRRPYGELRRAQNAVR